MAIDVNFSPC